MSLLKTDCPRCGAKHATFDVSAQNSRGIVRYDWSERFEIFGVCRACHKATAFIVDNKSYEARAVWSDVSSGVVKYSGYLNDHFDVSGYISLKDHGADDPPEHVPGPIAEIFTEAATCVTVRCWNAAGAMFRTAVDLATKGLLPPADEAPAAKVRRSLGLRLEWMFENGKLPPDLKDLAECIKEDGNDGVHDASLTENEALDLQDFTIHLLERLYTVPKRVELAGTRRIERRGK